MELYQRMMVVAQKKHDCYHLLVEDESCPVLYSYLQSCSSPDRSMVLLTVVVLKAMTGDRSTIGKQLDIALSSPLSNVQSNFNKVHVSNMEKDHPIMQQFSIARTPQQNGVVERRNRTLVEAARTMLIFSRLPEFLWAEAVATAYDLMNTPSKEDLDNLFGPMFEDYFEQKSSDTTINSAAQPTHDQEDTPSTSSIIVDIHEARPVVTTSDKQTSPISLQESDEFNQEDSADFDGNTQFVPYDSLNHEEIESSTTNLEP
ncbi:retrovirus-related pol polyprotein from transposon TNT 1-94 [Tanacetum coccineum]